MAHDEDLVRYEHGHETGEPVDAVERVVLPQPASRSTLSSKRTFVPLYPVDARRGHGRRDGATTQLLCFV